MSFLEILREVKNLFGSLQYEWELGLSLEARPGLKFLLQRLCGLRYPANLLRACITSFSTTLITLFRFCCLDLTLASNQNGRQDRTESVTTTKPLRHSSTSFRSKYAKASEIPSGPSPNKVILNNSKSNITELKETFERLCIIISSFQEQPSPEPKPNPSNTPIGPKLSTKLEEPFQWCENIVAIKNTLNFELNGAEQSWNTSIGTVEEWREERKLQLTSWIFVLRKLLEFLLQQSNPQFKSILPALFEPLSSLIAAARDAICQKMLSDVIMRCGVVYGIV